MGVVLILEVGLHLELLNDTTKQWLKLNNFFLTLNTLTSGMKIMHILTNVSHFSFSMMDKSYLFFKLNARSRFNLYICFGARTVYKISVNNLR